MIKTVLVLVATTILSSTSLAGADAPGHIEARKPKFARWGAFAVANQALVEDSDGAPKIGVGGEVRLGRYRTFGLLEVELAFSAEDFAMKNLGSINRQLGALYIGAGIGLNGFSVGKWSGYATQVHGHVGADVGRIGRMPLTVRGRIAHTAAFTESASTITAERPSDASRVELSISVGLLF